MQNYISRTSLRDAKLPSTQEVKGDDRIKNICIEDTSDIREDNSKRSRVGDLHQCLTCERFYVTKAKLKRHVSRYHSERKMKCKLCGKAFSFKPHFNEHMECHMGKKYQCHHCGELYSRTGLRNHLKSVIHGKSVQCVLCERRFTNATYMKAHLQGFHKQGTPERCTLCGKVFYFQGQLRRHMRIHAKFDYGCDLCDKRFLEKLYLTKHMRTHEQNPKQAEQKEDKEANTSLS